MRQAAIQEHDGEPIDGLPAVPPEGEQVLWQGKPDGRAIARRAVAVRWIAAYFALLIAYALYSGATNGSGLVGAIPAAAILMLLAGIVIGMLELYAWGVQKTTLYTITNERLVMRVGVALSTTVNVPFSTIASADVRPDGSGCADIAFRLKDGATVSWLMLWPHVRPWTFGKTMPAMRCLRDHEAVADLLARALRAHELQQAGADGKVVAMPRPVAAPKREARMPKGLKAAG